MKPRYRELVFALFVISVLVLQGCVATPAQPTGEATTAEPKPPLAVEATGAQFTHLATLWIVTGAQSATLPWITMGLGYQAADMSLQPALAESWDVSPDATQWTFHIRPEAVWSDGEPVTAMDAKMTYELLLDPATGSTSFTADLANVKGAAAFKAGEADEVTGIVVVDDKTVRFDLETGNAVFWQMAKFPLMPYHILGDVPAAEIAEQPFVDNPTPSNGPFKFVRREIDQYIEMERWAEWWGNAIWGPIGVDRIIAVDVPDTATAVAQFEAGELAMARLPLDELERFEAMDDVEVQCVPSTGPSEYMFNHERLNDVRWLQAFDYALDKEAINEAMTLGRGELVATTIMGPDWALNPDVKPREYDPEKAKALLEESNWDFDRVVKFYSYNDESSMKLASIFQEYLADIGVKVEITPFPGAQDVDVLTGPDWEVFIMGGGDLVSDPNGSAAYFTTASVWANDWQDYLNPELDELFAQGVALGDPADRAPIYYEIQEILHRDLPWLTLYRSPVCWATHPSMIQGFTASGTNVATYSLLDWEQP